MTVAEQLRTYTDEQLSEALVDFASAWHLALTEKGECWGKGEVLKKLLEPVCIEGGTDVAPSSDAKS